MSGSDRDDPSQYLRTELLERIAHELRGPAGVTLGALEELELSLGPALASENRLLFAMARRGARRVLRTAERLARTALLESTDAHIRCEPTDVRGLVKQALEDAELIEGRSKVRTSLSVPEEPCLCMADGGWLQVALAELISQAIRGARGEVAVCVEPRETFVNVSVRDDRSTAAHQARAVRFVAEEDRRDAALGWPLVCDVARAHGAELNADTIRGADGTIAGARITLKLRTS